MVTYAQLSDLRPAEFEEAADGWHKVSSAAGHAVDRLNHKITAGIRESLEGKGSNAALERLTRLSDNFQYTQTECGLIRSALNDLAGDLRAAKKKLDDAVDEAREAGFQVGPDGSVQWTDEEDEEAEAKKRKAQEYADRIGDALSNATKADRTWARVLRGLKARNDLDVIDADWADMGKDTKAVRDSLGGDLPRSDIPKGTSPRENAAWWKSLTDEQRAEYLTLYPAAIGALDGLPATVRDDANRTILAAKTGALELEIPPEPKKYGTGAQGHKYTTAEWNAWYEKCGKRHAQLKGMRAIEARFDETGENGLPEAYLLGFDPTGDGRAIIANGNPDTADHTAVYVPGTGSNLGNIGDGIDRTTDLWQSSQLLADGEKVSTITWYGYDAPDSAYTDAPYGHYADDGAPAFNRFMTGLETSHAPGSDSHTTVVAHSYGTTLVGSAARQGDLHADDIIFAGSPGVQVEHATDLDVPKGHVWNEEAQGDPVPDIGRFGHGHPGDTGGFLTPSHPDFGANQMTTDTQGHSGYWEPGSESLRNQAAVVTGNYDDVQTKDDRENSWPRTGHPSA
ncbi:MAG: alpha/beta hydrolase [Streptomyces sp.]|uniref:alpha/beta hydrolase n=1 Tax=Streptomyces sp. TaxID=1931 RepID=UPI003D6B6E0B